MGSGLRPDPPLTHPCGRGHPASPKGQAGEPGGRRRGSRGHLTAPAGWVCGVAKGVRRGEGHTLREEDVERVWLVVLRRVVDL